LSFKQQIKEYFSFSKGETKGMVILLVLIFTVSLMNIFSNTFSVNKKQDISSFIQEINAFEKQKKSLDSSYHINFSGFMFNPNQTNDDEWRKLGMNEKQIRTINNYLLKGGQFNIKSDLRKIYGISEKQYSQLEPFIDLPDIKEDYNNSHTYHDFKKLNKTELFFFDPNLINDSEWMKLGFSEKQVKIIRNYINSGGTFYQKEDLKKVFVINDEKYNELKDFIIINTDRISNKKNNDIIENSFNSQKVDINTFTLEQFSELGGSWKYFASRIVKYRNYLGGFHTKEQLLEVYGFTKDFYDKISNVVEIDLSKVEKINVNFAEVNELSKHPYLNYDDAQKIIDYRNKKGALKDINELYNNNIISSETFQKIKFYLSIK
jgi:DNA uptake protein ComE-like DNA-binding protein